MSFERLVGASSDGGDTHKTTYFQVGLAHLLEDKIPRFLMTPIDALYVGTFKEFEEKQINMYEDL